MKIAFRVDGGSRIGMGHIMRSLVLAKELSLQNQVFFVCRIEKDVCENGNNFESGVSDKYLGGIKKIRAEGFRVELIREKYVLEDLKTIEADVLITDSYDVNQNYFDEIKKMFSKTVYIDDVNPFSLNVDVLINQNINGCELQYKVKELTQCLVGTKYVMLRDEFQKTAPIDIKEKIKDIMITVGGSDPNNFTEKIIKWVSDLDYNFHIVIGPSFEKRKFQLNESENIKMYHNADMYEIMKKCDLAISSSGSTLYELAVCGVPTLGLIVAENQKGIAEKFDSLGVIRSLGLIEDINNEKIRIEISEMSYNDRKSMSKKGRSLIDGSGVKRIADVINALQI